MNDSQKNVQLLACCSIPVAVQWYTANGEAVLPDLKDFMSGLVKKTGACVPVKRAIMAVFDRDEIMRGGWIFASGSAGLSCVRRE